MIAKLRKYKSLTISVGDRFGLLTVLSLGRRGRRYFAVCDCDCGTKSFATRTDGLKSGHTQSCGCLHLKSITKHGLWSHPLYQTWNNMMRRCYHPSNKRWKEYGGRGIKVCPQWHDVSTFIADMSPSHSPKMEIDRIDVNGDYAPSNCKWSTHTEQARNKRNLILITHAGKTQTASQWAVENGLSYGTVRERLRKLEWDPIKAITTPARSAGSRTFRSPKV